ncbi:thioredoxin domain-containing protein [Pseudonocardia nematodicida]|uniref:Thioredoxin domain-containing protein n=1 Tax=Pseudonocardia nematodicida TaxID=1206997 RepID=A0ABV1KA30_9PSEU
MSRRSAPGPPVTERRGPSQATVIGAVVVLVFAVLVGAAVYAKTRPAEVVTPPNASGYSVPVGDAGAPATIDVYLDFQCPVCKQFEATSGPTVDKLVAGGQARVAYHPIAILDRTSPDRYSTRAGAASGCAAADGVFPQYAKALYANQPAEGSAGLTDQKLAELGTQAGGSPGFAQCVDDQTYAGWIGAATAQAAKDGISGTPTVLVNGAPLQNPTPQAITQAVAAAR